MKKTMISILAFIVLIILVGCSENYSDTDLSYKYSNASYEELNSEVGCHSKYSKAKKKDIFNSRYKNHWMVWSGEIVLSDADSVSLNIDGKGTQDLAVDFIDKNAGYNLMEGSFISVRFLMKSTGAGGCILPFGGEKATIEAYNKVTE